jgi:hypothetical protein
MNFARLGRRQLINIQPKPVPSMSFFGRIPCDGQSGSSMNPLSCPMSKLDSPVVHHIAGGPRGRAPMAPLLTSDDAGFFLTLDFICRTLKP